MRRPHGLTSSFLCCVTVGLLSAFNGCGKDTPSTVTSPLAEESVEQKPTTEAPMKEGRLADDSTEPEEGGPPITLAVVRFEDKGTSVEFNRLGAAIAEMLAHDLSEFKKLRILERTAAGDLILERNLAETNIVGDSHGSTDKLAAEYLVTGTCNVSAGKLVVTASLTKVGSDMPQEKWEHTGTVDEFMGFEAALVKQVTEALQVKGVPRRTVAPETSVTSPTLAILTLNNNSPKAELDVMQEGFADMLQSSLGAIEGVRLVERAQIENILKEQKLSLSGLVDPQTAVQVGQLLQAERLLVGSFLEVGTDLGIQVRLVDTQSGSVVASERVSGPREQFAELLEDLTLKILSDLLLKPANDTKSLVQAALPARSMEAAIHMATGQRLVSEGRDPQSVEAYQQVLLLEPGNIIAHLRQMKAYWRLGQTNDIDRVGSRALALPEFSRMPQRWEILHLLAQVYLDQNRYPELVRVTDLLVEQFPQNTNWANSMRGAALLRLNQWDEGVKLMEQIAPDEPAPETDWQDVGLKQLFIFYAFQSDDYRAPAATRTPEKRREMCQRALKIFDRILISAAGKRDYYATSWAELLIPNGINSLTTYDEEGVVREFLSPAERVDAMQRALDVFDWHLVSRGEGTFALGVSAEKAEMWDVAMKAFREFLDAGPELVKHVGRHQGAFLTSFDFSGYQPNEWHDQKVEAYYRLAKIAHEGLNQPDQATVAYQDMVREVGLTNFRGTAAVAAMHKLGIEPAYPEKCCLVWGFGGFGQRSWERVLEPSGYKVHGLKSRVVTEAQLAPYSLIVLVRPGIIVFTPTEMLALRSYVAKGGSLLVVVSPGWEPAAPAIHSGLLKFFDVEVGQTLPSRTKATRMVPHPITEGIPETMAKAGVALKAPAESIVIGADDAALLTASEYRFGRVIVAAFGQWLLPDPSIFPRGWQDHRSEHWTLQTPSEDLPFEEGEGLCRPLLDNTIAWLEKHPQRSPEFEQWKETLAAAHWTDWRVHVQALDWNEMAAPHSRMIGAAPDAVSREESLWTAGEAYHSPCYVPFDQQHLAWPAYGYQPDKIQDPHPEHYEKLLELYPNSPLYYYAQWRLAECKRMKLAYQAARNGWHFDPARTQEAIAAYDNVSAPPGSYPWAWTRIRQSTLAYQLGDSAKGNEYVKDVIEQMPNGPERTVALLNSAACLMATNQTSEAKRIFNEVNSLPLLNWFGTEHDWVAEWYPVGHGMFTSRQAAFFALQHLDQQK
ncbi:MAG: DUF4350 domain-containing protein [Planctomycetaceae bacterium]